MYTIFMIRTLHLLMKQGSFVEENVMGGFVLYLVIINLFAIYIMRTDKNKARQSIYRIPERVFFVIAVLGGSVGLLFGMYRYRHKTRKLGFKIGIPLIAIAEGLLFIMYLMNK